MTARAQQPAMPVIGYLSTGSRESDPVNLAAFRQGLGEIGDVEGQNVTIEYRWAEFHYDRLSAMADDLVRRPLTAIDPREEKVIDAALAALARQPNGGVIVTASSSGVAHRDFLIEAALRYRLPAVYPLPFYTPAGGLASYGPDPVDIYTRAAAYVDRILRGERPADLPVQAPTKYQLAINLKTAGAIGIAVPQSLLARAEVVIE
jgi:hypothetical protein